MERRAFLAATTAAAVTSADALAAAAGTTAEPGTPARPQVLELSATTACAAARSPPASPGTRRTPSSPRSAGPGPAPIGAWNVAMGPDGPTVHLLLPHPDAGSVLTLDERLVADGEYRKAAASSLALPQGEAPFLACDYLPPRRGRARLPGVEKPQGAAAGTPPASSSCGPTAARPRRPSRRKIEMFEAGGELALFRRARASTRSSSAATSWARAAAQPDLHGGVRATPPRGSRPGRPSATTRSGSGCATTPATPTSSRGIDSALLRPTDYSQV